MLDQTSKHTDLLDNMNISLKFVFLISEVVNLKHLSFSHSAYVHSYSVLFSVDFFLALKPGI